MKVTSPPDVANLPMYPFRYSRSRHSTSNVTCRLAIRECSPCPRFYGIPTQAACRFEFEDFATLGGPGSDSSKPYRYDPAHPDPVQWYTLGATLLACLRGFTG